MSTSWFKSSQWREDQRLTTFNSTNTLRVRGFADIIQLWANRINAVGGTMEGDSIDIAEALVGALQGEPYYSQIIWLAPLLGANVAAARVPLIDTLGAGVSALTGFVNADFDQAVGLENTTEANKWMNSNIRPSQLGVSNNGGIGWWELNWGAGSNVEPLGCYSSGGQRFVIDGRSNVRSFRWGTASNGGGDSSSFANGHYYGQRASSTSRKIYLNGVQIGTENTAGDGATGAADRPMYWHGCNDAAPTPWKGTCGVAYMTDGILTDPSIAALHTLLDTYLITPTGR